MATTYKVLGQLAPSAAALSTLYTVPAATSVVCSSLTVCNQSAVATTFRIAVRPAGAGIAAAHYLAYDTALGGNDMLSLTLGITLAATDVVSGYATLATVSFSLFGSEIT